jgi:serine/threonine protein kinase
MTDASPALPGPVPGSDTFGKYRILEEIGRGGMGIVYKALHTKIGKIVALKILKAGDQALDRQLQMFQREIESMAKFSHPNIITIYDVGQESGHRYFTMAYVDGCTLEELMNGMRRAEESGSSGSSFKDIVETIQKERQTPGPDRPADAASAVHKVGGFRALRLTQTLSIAGKILRALEHAHERGVIHRDIKPSNIIVTKDGEPILMDFGLAREMLDDGDKNMTRTGQVLGTPAYMSPEQAEGIKGRIDERSDIYSMGAVFYEMLTGRPPYIPTGNAIRDIWDAMRTDPRPVRKLNPDISRDVETICAKAMEKDRVRRYRTAGAFAADIQRYIEGDPILARPQSLFYRAKKKIVKHRAVSVSAAIIIGFLLIGLGYRHVVRQALKAKDAALQAEYRKGVGKWKLVYEDDFNSGYLDTSRWINIRPDLNDLKFGLESGALFLWGHGGLFSMEKVTGNIKIVFDMKMTEPSELNLRFKIGPSHGETDIHYRFMWAGSVVKFYKEGMWKRGGFKEMRFKGFEKYFLNISEHNDRWFHVEVVFEDGVMRAFIDSLEVVVFEDYIPLVSPENDMWGFRVYRGKMLVDNLRLYQQTFPQKLDVSSIPDILFNRYDFQGALDHIVATTVNYDDSRIVSRCVGKALSMKYVDPGLYPASRLLEIAGALFPKIDQATRENILEDGSRECLAQNNVPLFLGAASQHARYLEGGDLFNFYVYLCLLFRNFGFHEEAQTYAELARTLAPGQFIPLDSEKRAASRPDRHPGPVKYIPAGYLPDRFGVCSRMEGFYMDSTEVTQGHYASLMDTNPSIFGGRNPLFSDVEANPDRPVENISVFDAIRFCNRRSEKEGFKPCYEIYNERDTLVYVESPVHLDSSRLALFGSADIEQVPVQVRKFSYRRLEGCEGYTLPSPRQREYALRAESVTHFYWGDSVEAADRYAWYLNNSGYRTHPVAKKAPNAFCLYDMAGNVEEMTLADSASAEDIFYAKSGSAWAAAQNLSSSLRTAPADKATVSGSLGFRCVRNAVNENGR